MERILRLLFSALEVLALRRMQRLRANAGGASTFSRRRRQYKLISRYYWNYEEVYRKFDTNMIELPEGY